MPLPVEPRPALPVPRCTASATACGEVNTARPARRSAQDAMIMGCDYYESESQRAALIQAGGVPMGIGTGSTLRNAIIDKNARIGDNVQIINKCATAEAQPPGRAAPS